MPNTDRTSSCRNAMNSTVGRRRRRFRTGAAGVRSLGAGAVATRLSRLESADAGRNGPEVGAEPRFLTFATGQPADADPGRRASATSVRGLVPPRHAATSKGGWRDARRPGQAIRARPVAQDACSRAMKAPRFAVSGKLVGSIFPDWLRRDICRSPLPSPDTFADNPDLLYVQADRANPLTWRFSGENAHERKQQSPRAARSRPNDWHPADVLAALKKRGHSLAGLSVANGYHPTAAGKALKQPGRRWSSCSRMRSASRPRTSGPAATTAREVRSGARRRDVPTSATLRLPSQPGRVRRPTLAEAVARLPALGGCRWF